MGLQGNSQGTESWASILARKIITFLLLPVAGGVLRRTLKDLCLCTVGGNWITQRNHSWLKNVCCLKNSFLQLITENIKDLSTKKALMRNCWFGMGSDQHLGIKRSPWLRGRKWGLQFHKPKKLKQAQQLSQIGMILSQILQRKTWLGQYLGFSFTDP